MQRLADYRGDGRDVRWVAPRHRDDRRRVARTGQTGAQQTVLLGVNWEIFAAVPDAAISGMVGDIRRDGVYIERRHKWSAEWAAGFHANHGVEALICMALTEAVRMDIGEREAKQILARLADPAAKISGYLADTIHAYMQHGAESSQGYERCSGCRSYTWFRAHPETWSTLLAHAPVSQVTETTINVIRTSAKKKRRARAKLSRHFDSTIRFTAGRPNKSQTCWQKLKDKNVGRGENSFELL